MITTVAVHQPNYFPWLGYFEKAMAADTFISLDHVQHVRQSLTRRTYVRKNVGSPDRSLLSVPLRDHDRFSPINELRIKGTDWVKDHRNKLHSVYRDTPYYASVSDNLLSKLDQFRDGDLLSEMNFELIRSCCVYIGITVNFRLSSRMERSTSGSKLMAELTEAEGGSAYYSGGGAGDYTDENDFGARGLAISYQRFAQYVRENPYTQHQGDWLPGLSVIDALCNIGPVGTAQYISNYSTWKSRIILEQDYDPLLACDAAPLYQLRRAKEVGRTMARS